MSGWFTSWWKSASVVGPARNLPSEVKDIKKFFEQKPIQVMIVSGGEIKAQLKSLKHVEPVKYDENRFKNPVTREIDTILVSGIAEYFQRQKQLRLEKRLKDEAEALHKAEQVAEAEAEAEAVEKAEEIEYDVEQEIAEFEELSDK